VAAAKATKDDSVFAVLEDVKVSDITFEIDIQAPDHGGHRIRLDRVREFINSDDIESTVSELVNELIADAVSNAYEEAEDQMTAYFEA
jgi:hypothetical protein